MPGNGKTADSEIIQPTNQNWALALTDFITEYNSQSSVSRFLKEIIKLTLQSCFAEYVQSSLLKYNTK